MGGSTFDDGGDSLTPVGSSFPSSGFEIMEKEGQHLLRDRGAVSKYRLVFEGKLQTPKGIRSPWAKILNVFKGSTNKDPEGPRHD